MTLTVSGELDEPDPDDLDDDDEEDGDEDSRLSSCWLASWSRSRSTAYIPLDPFFVVARMVDGQAELVEGEDFDRIQPRLEAELEDREWPE